MEKKDNQPKNSDQKEPKQYNQYVKYSGLAIQMAVSVYLGHMLGSYFDAKAGGDSEIYAQGLTLLAVFLSSFIIIRQVIKTNSDSDK